MVVNWIMFVYQVSGCLIVNMVKVVISHCYLKFYVEILKIKGSLDSDCMENGFIGCKICKKKEVIIQADDIS